MTSSTRPGSVHLSPQIRTDPIRLVDEAAPVGGAELVRACIDHLAGATTLDLQLTPPLLAFAERHRIRSLLTALGDTADEAHNVTVLALHLTSAARRTVNQLAEIGVDAVILKGLATSHLDYPAGAVRHTGDVDLLVPDGDFARACQTLGQHYEPLKAGEPTDLLVEQTFRTPSGIELDVHHRLFRFGPHGSKELYGQLMPLPNELGHALDPAGRLVHAAGHLFLSPPEHRRLSSLVDVALIQTRQDLDEDRVDDLARLFGIIDLVSVARWLAVAIGNPEPPPPPRISKSAINRAYLRTSRSVARETIAVLANQTSTRNRLRYLAYQSRRLIVS